MVSRAIELVLAQSIKESWIRLDGWHTWSKNELNKIQREHDHTDEQYKYKQIGDHTFGVCSPSADGIGTEWEEGSIIPSSQQFVSSSWPPPMATASLSWRLPAMATAASSSVLREFQEPSVLSRTDGYVSLAEALEPLFFSRATDAALDALTSTRQASEKVLQGSQFAGVRNFFPWRC